MENQAESPWVLERVVVGGLTRLHYGVMTIGRSSNCNITIASDYVSRTHAEFQITPGTDDIQIRDLGSTNGIFVNDAVCKRAIRKLSVGDRVGIGVTVEDDLITEDGRYPIYILKREPLKDKNADVEQLNGAIKKHNEIQENGNVQENAAIQENIQSNTEVAQSLPKPHENEEQHQSDEYILMSDDDFDSDDDVDDFVEPQGIKLLELEGYLKLSPPTVSPDNENQSKISENIQSIFGDLNEDVLNKLSKEARDIAQANTSKPNQLNGVKEDDVICISSDDETDVRNQISKSPDIFDDSNKSVQNVQNEVIQKERSESFNASLQKEAPAKTTVNQLEAPIVSSRLDDVDDNEEEELYFTQQLLDDLREELPEAENDYGLNEEGESIKAKIKQENNINNSNDYIVLDDDDDEYDEVLETKVYDWSLKLFSQSFSNSFNSSQIYEDNLDSASAAPTEGIFINIDEDNDEDSNGSDQVANELLSDPIVRGLISSSPSEKENDKEKDSGENSDDRSESPLIRQCKQNLKCKFLFSSSSEEDIREEVKKNKKKTSGSSRSRQKESHALRRSTSDEIPQKKRRLDERGKQEGKELITSDTEKKYKQVKQLVRQSSISLESDSVRRNYQSSKPKQDRSSEIDIFDLLKEDGQHVATNKATKESRQPKDSSRSDKAIDKNTSASYKSASFARQKSHEKQSFADEENVADFEEKLNSSQKKKKTLNRGPPEIIAAPQLPINRGKLRGLSAVRQRSVIEIKSINVQKDLKQKWMEKPSIAKRKEKEKCKLIKEDRKQKLKELAEKHKSELSNTNNINTNRKMLEKISGEKPKVKITQVNRGAFLTKDTVKPYKIPKTYAKPNKPLNTTSDPVVLQKPASSKTIPTEVATSFSKELLKVDEILQNNHKPTMSTAIRDRRKSQDVQTEQKARAPIRRNSRKLTFHDMEEHFVETKRLQNIQITLSKVSCMKSPLQKSKTKKTVRFNDVPQIRYIERVQNATKKIDKKEPSIYNDRKIIIRRKFPTVDHTDELITDVLTWSQNWLLTRSAEFNRDGSNEIIYPMTNKFSSINDYKNTVFPLLKIEYLSHLERHMQRYASKPGYDVRIDYFTPLKNKELMFARCFVPIKKSELSVNDLILIDIVVSPTQAYQCFGFVGNIRKTGTCTVLSIEIGENVIATEHFKTFKQVTVRRIIEAIRVYFGSFNAVHQLEKTPLYEKILNPIDLLNVKTHYRPTMQYKGCDPLNSEQTEILLKTYAKGIDEYNPNITLINGPPGTGKSRLITNLALQFLYGNEVRMLDKKILICAQSNMAVDVIARQLYDIQNKLSKRAPKYQVIRFGKEEKIHHAVRDITVNKLIQRDHESRILAQSGLTEQSTIGENLKNEILKLEARVAELENENLKDVRQDELIELRKNLALKKNFQKQVIRPEDERRLVEMYLENANIICTTLSSCVKLSHYVKYFDVCIIDEATQCIEPWGIMPLKFGITTLVMVGDTQQLPATIISQKAKEYGLGKSLFTRIQGNLENSDIGDANPIQTLHTQYRMNPEICKWPNMYFYKNLLLNASTTSEFKSKIKPLSILNLQYNQNDHCQNGKIANSLEAEFVAELVKKLDAYIPNKYYSYGVITPYAQHREKLEAMLRDSSLRNVMVNTIDSYQGIEKDVIIISNARTQGIGFLADYQRLNVAVTRPKKCLILCGNFKNLETVPSWASLLANAKERGLFHDISIADAVDIDNNVLDKIKIKP